MAYQSWSVVFGEQPSAAKWNILGTNDAGFNDGTAIGTGAITASKLLLGGATNSVATSETRANAAYGALTTAQSVTVTIGAGLQALVFISALIYTTTGAADAYLGFALSGANTVAATDAQALSNIATTGISVGRSFLLTALTAGSTTFSVQARCATGTGNYANRNISVIPIG